MFAHFQRILLKLIEKVGVYLAKFYITFLLNV